MLEDEHNKQSQQPVFHCSSFITANFSTVTTYIYQKTFMEMSTVPAQAPLQSDTVKSVPLLFIFSPEL